MSSDGPNENLGAYKDTSASPAFFKINLTEIRFL